MAKKNYSLFEIQVGKNFASGISTNVDWEPVTNIIEAEGRITIEVELPGVEKSDVSVILNSPGEIVISGTKKQTRQSSNNISYFLFEREFGSFHKKITIDMPLETDKINSVMEKGVLFIEIPKKKKIKHSIEIK